LVSTEQVVFRGTLLCSCYGLGQMTVAMAVGP